MSEAIYNEYFIQTMKSHLCVSEFTNSLYKTKLLNLLVSIRPRFIYLIPVLVSNLPCLVNSFLTVKNMLPDLIGVFFVASLD